jgi:hypothetical protein
MHGHLHRFDRVRHRISQAERSQQRLGTRCDLSGDSLDLGTANPNRQPADDIELLGHTLLPTTERPIQAELGLNTAQIIGERLDCSRASESCRPRPLGGVWNREKQLAECVFELGHAYRVWHASIWRQPRAKSVENSGNIDV